MLLILFDFLIQASSTSRNLFFYYSLSLSLFVVVSYVLNRQITKRQLLETDFQDLYNNAPCGYHSLDKDGKFIAINDTELSWLGYNRDEVIGKLKITDVLTSESAAKFRENLALCLERGLIKNLELQLICKDGMTFPAIANATVIKDADGNFIATRTTLFDIEDVTDSKRVQKALQESQAQLQAIIDNSPAIIYLTDSQNRYILINRRYESLFNITRERIVGKNVYEIWPDEIADKFAANNRKVLEGGTSIEVEEVAPLEDGLHTYITVKFPLHDANGIPYAVCGISTDITERKQAEEELAKLIAILEATPDFISSSSVDGKVFYLNRSAREILGFGQSEELANFDVPNGHPDWAYEIIHNEAIPAATRDGIWIGETALLNHEGQEIPLSQLIVAHKSSDGSVNMLSTIARDITQQKQIEATLREAERRWRTLLENVRLVVVGRDKNGKLNYVNPYFLELVGYTKAEALGKDWFETFLPLYQRKRLQNNYLELLEQKFYTHNQNIILTKSGEERMIAWNNTLLQDLQGNAIGTLSIGEDITERQVIERMKDEFISVVSHELRTPLASIHGALNLLSSGLVNTQSDKGRRVMEIATESAERLVRLVNDILELERLESGKISLSRQTCNVAELMLKASEMMQVMANRADITLSVSPEAIQLDADPDRIVQVLTNLLGNAIKFSPIGSTVWLTVELQAGGNSGSVVKWQNLSPSFPHPIPPTLLFNVKDQGRGIPQDKIESIFDRFHQVDASDSRKKGGAGLGLAICRSIVQQHGGQIWVESTLGEGSTFYFTLPVLTVEEDEHDNQANLGD